MRCKICDWSPDGVQSTYHVGLALPRVSHSTDPETGEISCDCFGSDVPYKDDPKFGALFLYENEEDLRLSRVGSMEEDGGNSDEL